MVALQALSGTGSLRIGAAFIAKFLPGTKVFVSDPTWGNHLNIFGDCGVAVEKYRCGRQCSTHTPRKGAQAASAAARDSSANNAAWPKPGSANGG